MKHVTLSIVRENNCTEVNATGMCTCYCPKHQNKQTVLHLNIFCLLLPKMTDDQTFNCITKDSLIKNALFLWKAKYIVCIYDTATPIKAKCATFPLKL